MLARLSRAAALAGLLCLPFPVEGADAPPADEGQALDVRRLSPEQRRRLLAGETIGYQVAETSETELGAGVAMYLPVPLARVAEALTSPDIVLKDASITAWGPLAPGATAAALAGYKLSTGESRGGAGRVRRGARRPASISRPPRSRPSARPAPRAAPTAPRWPRAAPPSGAPCSSSARRPSRRAGSTASPPYARRGGVTDPAALLRVAAGDARIVAHLMPRLADALLRFPAEQSPTTISQLYWVKRQVQGRPGPDPGPPSRRCHAPARAVRRAARLRGPYLQREPDPLRRGAVRRRRRRLLEQSRLHRPGRRPRRGAEAHDRPAPAPRRDRQALRSHPRRAA